MSGRRSPPSPPSPQPLSALAARLTDGAGAAAPGRAIGARWDRLRAALDDAPVAARPRRRWVMAGGAGALVAAAVLLTLRLWPGPRVTYALAGATLGGDGYISGVAAASAALTFSEGTKVDLLPGSRAWVVSTDHRGARVRLEDGRAHFSVVHRSRARWTVEAGPFTVQVTGTTFDVRWSGGDDLFEVHLIAGGVDVHGPLTGDGVRLRAGETLRARVNQGVVHIARAAAPVQIQSPPEVPARAAAPAMAEAPRADPPPPVEPDPQAPPPRPVRRRVLARATAGAAINIGGSWRQRVASGDFRSVLDEAEEQGIDVCLRLLPEDRLATLADAARYAGRGALAQQTLLAERRRFPGTPPARRAAFLLGRLAEEGGEPPAAALGWYETYLDEAPAGSYAGEALGRRMLVINRRDGAAARPVAAEYLRRFPAGAYAGPARAIAGEPGSGTMTGGR